ncbi:MAG: hypothetical protein CYPHOPRED_001498, partial [Cyphobasidiales sp. Tagirdzhanova-0007]
MGEKVTSLTEIWSLLLTEGPSPASITGWEWGGLLLPVISAQRKGAGDHRESEGKSIYTDFYTETSQLLSDVSQDYLEADEDRRRGWGSARKTYGLPDERWRGVEENRGTDV